MSTNRAGLPLSPAGRRRRAARKRAVAAAALLERVVADLRQGYDLVYVDYNDRLSDEQVAAMVRGDWESLWDGTCEWESDSRASGADYVITEIRNDLTDEERDVFDDIEGDVRDIICERDTSNWLKDLARNTPNVLMRVLAISEDDAFAFREVTAAQVLDAVGFEHTPENLRTVEKALLECSPEFSVLMGYWVFSADVEDLVDLPYEGKVRITCPHLYLGNPFSGTGYITDDPLTGWVEVDRADLRTDKDAFGYGVDEIFGGLLSSPFLAVVEAVTEMQEAS